MEDGERHARYAGEERSEVQNGVHGLVDLCLRRLGVHTHVCTERVLKCARQLAVAAVSGLGLAGRGREIHASRRGCTVSAVGFL